MPRSARLLVDGEEEVLLRREVRVDGALRVARLIRDRVERGGVKAVAREQPIRRRDQVRARLRLSLFSCRRSSHTVSIYILTVSIQEGPRIPAAVAGTAEAGLFPGPDSHAAPQRQQLISWRAIGARQVRHSRAWCRSRMTISSRRCDSAAARRGSTGRLWARQRHGLGGRAVAPTLDVTPCLRTSCPAFVEVADAIDERVVRSCPTALGDAVVGGDRSKADEFGEIAGALQRGSAVGAHLVEEMGRAIGWRGSCRSPPECWCASAQDPGARCATSVKRSASPSAPRTASSQLTDATARRAAARGPPYTTRSSPTSRSPTRSPWPAGRRPARILAGHDSPGTSGRGDAGPISNRSRASRAAEPTPRGARRDSLTVAGAGREPVAMHSNSEGQ